MLFLVTLFDFLWMLNKFSLYFWADQSAWGHSNPKKLD
jgi:hypothetical protein